MSGCLVHSPGSVRAMLMSLPVARPCAGLMSLARPCYFEAYIKEVLVDDKLLCL